MTVVTSIGFWPDDKPQVRVSPGRGTVTVADSVLLVHDDPQALRDLGDALLDAARQLDSQKVSA